MNQKESVFHIVITILDFVLALLCALCAVRDLSREGAARLRSGILWLVTAGACFACGILDLVRQDRLSIEIVRECDIGSEDLENLEEEPE